MIDEKFVIEAIHEAVRIVAERLGVDNAFWLPTKELFNAIEEKDSTASSLLNEYSEIYISYFKNPDVNNILRRDNIRQQLFNYLKTLTIK